MLEFAEWSFKLSRQDKDGISLEDHLKQVWKTTKRKPAELEPPNFPDVIGYVWSWFLELNAARPTTGFGAAPITYSEISCWNTLTGARVSSWEVALLKDLDILFLRSRSEKKPNA